MLCKTARARTITSNRKYREREFLWTTVNCDARRFASGVSAVSPVWAQFDLGKMLDVGKDLAKSESLSDEELKNTFDQMSAEMDRQNPVAPAGNPYAKRLAKLTSGLARTTA